MMVEVRSVYDNHVVMSTKRSKSNVWQFFEKVEEKISRCRLCQQECRTGGNTSNLWDHFKRKHTMVFVDNTENEAVSMQYIENIPRVKDDSESYPKPVRKKPRKTIVCSDIDELKDKKIIPLPGGRSEVWKQKLFGFYSNDGKTIIDKQRAVCTLCFSEIPYSGNTTNLGIHLAKKHPDHYHKMKTELDDPKSDGEDTTMGVRSPKVSSVVSMMPRGGFRAVNITEAVASFLIRDLHTLDVANGEGFRQLVNVLEPRYEALDPDQLSEVLLKRKLAITEVLRDKLNEIEACALIADCWSVEEGLHYCTLMVRFIDNDWEVQNYVLQTIQMGEQVLLDVNKVLADWGVMPRLRPESVDNQDMNAWTIEASPVKIVASVTNESNYNVDCVRNLCSTTGTPNLPCFINVVNHAVLAGLESEVVSEIVEKARGVVSYFIHTIKLQLNEEGVEKDFTMLLNDLTLDLKYRWATTAFMLEKLLSFLKNSLAYAYLDSGDMENDKKIKLSSNEKIQLEILQDALNGFSVAIGVLGSEEAACSMVTPLLHRKKEKLSKITESEDTAVFNLVKTLWENLDPHYSDKEVQSFLNLATFLDPRFKDLVDLSEEAKQEVHHTIRALIEQESQHSLIITIKANEEEDDDEGGASPAKRSRQRIQELDLLFGTMDGDKELHGSIVGGSDLDRYLQEKSVAMKESPLEWWSKNWQRFPVLAKFAKRYLCAPATAVPSAHILTPEGSVFHNRRKKLLPEEVDLMIFLNKNLNLLC